MDRHFAKSIIKLVENKFISFVRGSFRQMFIRNTVSIAPTGRVSAYWNFKFAISLAVK
jgi:hypothetical protein